MENPNLILDGDAIDLLPCPFCGDTGRVRCNPEQGFYVDCQCDCFTAFYTKESDAMSAWNRRADDADRARLVARIGELEAKVTRLMAELMAADDEMLTREAADNE